MRTNAIWLSLVLAVLGVAACSSDDDTKQSDATGGTSGATSVGGKTAIGGKTSSGGTSAAQGGSAIGGGSSTAGATGNVGGIAGSTSSTVSAAGNAGTTGAMAGATGTTGGTSGVAGSSGLAGKANGTAGSGIAGGANAGAAGTPITGIAGSPNAGASSVAGKSSTAGNAGSAGSAGAAGAPAVAWLDTATGLTWQVGTQDNLSFAETATYCAGLAIDGHDDWRVPTIGELRTIISGCSATLPTGTCGVTNTCLAAVTCRDDTCGGCVAIPESCYVKPQLAGTCGFVWSSSTQSDYTDNAWGVGFNGGHVSADLKLNAGSARCVRP